MRQRAVSMGVLCGFVLSAGLITGIGYLSVQSTAVQRESALAVSHTHQVRLALDQLLRAVVEAQNGRRGYVLARDERFLSAFEQALGRIEGTFASLKTLLADNPDQQERLVQIRPLLDRQVGYLRQSIAWARGGAPNAFDQAALTESSRELLAHISGLVQTMDDEEASRLAERVAWASASAERSRLLTIAGSLTAVMVLVAVFARMAAESTGRLRSEKRAIASEARFAGILDIAEDAVITFDERMNVVIYNQGAEKIFGWRPAEALGKPLDMLIPARYRHAHGAHVQAFRGSPEAARMMNARREIFGLRKDGSEFPAEASISRLDLGGERVFTVILRDITARKVLEQERDRYFALSADLMCISGSDGYFKRLNPAWERTLGWTIEELMSRPFIDFIHPDDRRATNDESGRANAGGRVDSFRNRYLCKDGSYRWLSWTSPGMAEGSTEIYAAARDVTSEIHTEERISGLNHELEQRATQLAASNKELEAFCYSVSHDLRAPLRAISGFSQIVEEENAAVLDDEARRLLGLIRSNTMRMGQLIDDLLSFSRTGRQAMRRARMEMNDIVETVARDLTSAAAPRRIVVTIGSLPAASADASMIRQVWVNLLSNAIKYTRERETARIEVTGRIQGGEVVYAVKDNGVGVDMKYAHKLFGVFQRLHSVSEFEGTGVGLALVHRIVQRHGGRVWVDSEPGDGAVFTFTIPQADAGDPDSAPDTEQKEEAAHA